MSAYGALELLPLTGRLFNPSQFPIVLFAMLVSTVPVSILGAHYAMGIRPFWMPDQYGGPTVCPLSTRRIELT